MLLTFGQKRCWCWKWLLFLYSNLPTRMSRPLQQQLPLKCIWTRLLAQSWCFTRKLFKFSPWLQCNFLPLDSQLCQFIVFFLVYPQNQNCMRTESVINAWSLIGLSVLLGHAFIKLFVALFCISSDCVNHVPHFPNLKSHLLSLW